MVCAGQSVARQPAGVGPQSGDLLEQGIVYIFISTSMLVCCHGAIVFYVIQASCVYDEYRYVVGCEGSEVEAYWEPNKSVHYTTQH